MKVRPVKHWKKAAASAIAIIATNVAPAFAGDVEDWATGAYYGLDAKLAEFGVPSPYGDDVKPATSRTPVLNAAYIDAQWCFKEKAAATLGHGINTGMGTYEMAIMANGFENVRNAAHASPDGYHYDPKAARVVAAKASEDCADIIRSGVAQNRILRLRQP